MSRTKVVTNLELDACAQEPIHVPGGIQPHGVLLALAGPDLRIVQASVNAGSVIGTETRSLIDQPIDTFLGDAQATALRGKLDRLDATDRAAHAGTATLRGPAGPQRFDLIVHRSGGMVVLELEYAVASDALEIEEFPTRMLQFLGGLEGQNSPESICTLAAQEVQRLSGFDRVLIYRFTEAWDGVVIAQHGNGRLPTLTGHRFPASDIPAQARELYRVNRSRIIPNAGYTPVPLLPRENPITGGPLDLTHSTLRSVSPVHLEYMRNMATAASMSFSVVRDGRLWGLIACHNVEPRGVPFNVRRACELVAQVFSLQLAAGERQAEIEYHVRLRQVGSRLLASMTSADDFAEGMLKNPADLLAAAAAEGAAVVTGETCRLIGRTPDEPAVQKLVDWLEREHPGVPVFHTASLWSIFPEAADYRADASGLMALSGSGRQRVYVLWFRPEMIETLTWAGNPHKAGAAGEPDRLSPRTSFDAWRETVHGKAAPWVRAEIDAVTELQNDVVAIVLRKAETLAAMSAELQRSNKELEAFSYSVSHDLRAPFRHIVGYSELVQEYEAASLSERGRRYIGTVIASAREAGKLIDNLLSFSQMGRAGLHPIELDMNVVVAEVWAEVMEAEGAGRRVQWTVGELPRVMGDLAMLRLALRNLLANAVKYTRDRGDDARVELRCVRKADEFVFSVRDNGVGFDMQYVDKLFGVFQRLHRVEEFEGTGIGLANVRRIVARHGGRTWAEGRLNEGATFYFTLPMVEQRKQ